MALNKNWYLTEVELDRANGYVQPLLAHESDVGGRGISLRVTDNGAPVDLTGYTLLLDWTAEKQWGNNEFTVVDAARGFFEITYPKAMQHPGRITARISIVKGQSFVTGSKNFIIDVQSAPVSDERVESSEEYSLIMRLLSDTQAALDKAQAATENVEIALEQVRTATTKATSAAASANNAASRAQSATTSANEAAAGARSAIDEATTATELANAAAENANKAGHDAWTAAPAATAAAEAAAEAAAKANSAASNAATAATDASSAATAANEAAERANAAAGGKVIEFCSTEVAVSAVRALF